MTYTILERGRGWKTTAGVVFFEYAIATPQYEVWENWGDEGERCIDVAIAEALR